MKIIPEDFYTKEDQYIHVTPGTEEAIYEVLAAEGVPVYHDFINFTKKWTGRDNYVVCYYSEEEDMVHINGNAEAYPEWTIYEAEDFLDRDEPAVAILDLLTI